MVTLTFGLEQPYFLKEIFKSLWSIAHNVYTHISEVELSNNSEIPFAIYSVLYIPDVLTLDPFMFFCIQIFLFSKYLEQSEPLSVRAAMLFLQKHYPFLICSLKL